MTAANPIRVLVADDHPLLREGIAAVIGRQADMVVVGEAAWRATRDSLDAVLKEASA